MNTLKVYGNITDPAKFTKFTTKKGDKGLFATIVMNKYKGKDSQGQAIKEPVYIKFAVYGEPANRLASLNTGARLIVELSPYNFSQEINGKQYQTVDFNCQNMTIIDWPKSEREDGQSYKKVEEINSDILETQGW